MELAIHRDRPKISIIISQPQFVGKLIDLYLAHTSSAKYPTAEDYSTTLKNMTYLPILSSDLQKLFQENIGNILYLSSNTHPDLLYSTIQLSREL